MSVSHTAEPATGGGEMIVVDRGAGAGAGAGGSGQLIVLCCWCCGC